MYDDVTPFSRCLQVQAFDPPPYFRSSSVFARALLCFGAALSAEEEKAIEADLFNSHPMVALGMKLTYGNACTVCCLHVRTVKTQFPQTTQASVSVQTKRSCSDLFQKSTERKCRLVQKRRVAKPTAGRERVPGGTVGSATHLQHTLGMETKSRPVPKARVRENRVRRPGRKDRHHYV